MWGCIPAKMIIGGASYTADDIDVSTGSSTAVIEGQPGAGTPCSVMQPARANRVTVDAGAVSLSISCFTYYRTAPDINPAKKSWVSYMEFEAEAGHGYRIEPEISRKGQNSVEHVSLVDLLTNEIIARAPTRQTSTHHYRDGSSDLNWAVIHCAGCLFNDRPSVALPPATVRLSSRWWTTKYWGFKGNEVELEFEAKPGHTYLIQRATNPKEEFSGAPDSADCAMVVDWTEDREFVTCVQIDWAEAKDGVRLSGDESTSDETVTVYCSGCRIFQDGLYTQMTFDAGKVELLAHSYLGHFPGGVLFSFDAVTGHSYVIRVNHSERRDAVYNRWQWVTVRLEDWSDGRKLIDEQFQ